MRSVATQRRVQTKATNGGEEDTEDLASEEEATTAMRVGEARWQRTAMVEDPEENGADGENRDAAASGGDTVDAISAAANKTGAGGRHGARTAAR